LGKDGDFEGEGSGPEQELTDGPSPWWNPECVDCGPPKRIEKWLIGMCDLLYPIYDDETRCLLFFCSQVLVDYVPSSATSLLTNPHIYDFFFKEDI